MPGDSRERYAIGADETTRQYWQRSIDRQRGTPVIPLAKRLGIGPYAKPYRSVMGETVLPDNPDLERHGGQLPLPGMQRSEIDQPPLHSLSPRQFAAQPEVWWHGKYGEEMTRDSYKEGEEAAKLHGQEDAPVFDDDEEGDDFSGHYGIHLGTREAALQRLNKLGPGRPQEEWDDAEGDVEIKRGGWNEMRRPGRLFPVVFDRQEVSGSVQRDLGHDWRPLMGYDEPVRHGGILYKNDVEEPGSISATFPTSDSFKTYNDIIGEADDPHPLLAHYARFAKEHTGEDILHENDSRLEAFNQRPHQQESLLTVLRPRGGIDYRLWSGELASEKPSKNTTALDA